MNITDYAFLFDATKDTKTYQHATTSQLFRTIEQVNSNGLELFIMVEGKWILQGIFNANQIAYQLSQSYYKPSKIDSLWLGCA